MGAIDAFRVTGDVLSRNPVLLGGAAVIGVGAMTLQAFNSLPVPFLGLLVGLLYFFVEPLLAGGYLNMANEGVDGDAGFDDFTDGARENYVDLLAARLITFAPFLVYSLVAAVVFFVVAGVAMVGAAGGPGADPGAGSDAMLGALGIVSVVFGVVLFGLPLIPGFVIQFYPAAIVVGDASALESFKYSYRLVREYPVSALGYTAVAALLGLVGFAVTTGVALLTGAGGSALQTALAGSSEGAAVGMAGSILLQVVALSITALLVRTALVFVGRTYYVSFVRAVTGTT
jgi:hypothetical protein